MQQIEHTAVKLDKASIIQAVPIVSIPQASPLYTSTSVNATLQLTFIQYEPEPN